MNEHDAMKHLHQNPDSIAQLFPIRFHRLIESIIRLDRNKFGKKLALGEKFVDRM